MLRTIRITAALVFFTLITLLFMDFTGTVHPWFGWLARIQFLPALLTFNISIILFLILLTLLLGRVYCSVICPLGIFQDLISWFTGKRKKNRFTYSPALNWLRYGMLSLFIIAIFADLSALMALLAPYSSYGRIAANLFSPVYQAANNGLATLAEKQDSYAFYTVDIWMKSLPTFCIALLTFIILFILASKNGRTYCNTICPVGSILGILSRFSLFKPVINISKCNGCGLCARNCKAACIHSKAHTIDYSRCVLCFDCIGKCRQGAITYAWRPRELSAGSSDKLSEKETDHSRRSFLTIGAMFVASATLKAQSTKVDGGLAAIEDKQIPNRTTPLVPPGSLSINNFTRHCTACQLCVSVCPNGVLRPSSKVLSLMQPEMSYEQGYCRPECTKCSEVCPAGAIRPITPAEKSATRIGHAVWIRKNCVVITDQVKCNNCMRHCPTGAIQLIASDPNTQDSLKIPVVNNEKCIGCGACEHLCPARPFSAMYVEGHQMHSIL